MQQKINKQDEIKILESDVVAVRKLPDVYIGALGINGFLNMIREIVQNSLDEIIKGNTLIKEIIVSYDARNKVVIVEDFGQAIPLDLVSKVFSKLHSSSNYDKKPGSGKYSSGKNGMGGTITNFLSEYFIVESYRMDGTACKVEFKEGILKSEKKIKCPKDKHGLMVTFAPTAMMGNFILEPDAIYDLLWKMTNLCLPGTKIIFNSINTSGKKNKAVIENKNGIYEILYSIVNKRVIEPIHYIQDNGTMKVELLITYDLSNMDGDPSIIGFANMCPTSGGTHVNGVLDGIVRYFRNYMNKIYLANNKKLTINAQDIRTGLCMVVSSFHLTPLFQGQSKDILSTEEMEPYAREVTLKALEQWATTNPNDLQKVAKYLKEVCEIRTKQDKEKVKMSDKYTTSVISGYPAGYKKPNGNKDIEVLIFEGKSASPENARDKEHQGIIGVRGKMPNPFTTPTKKYFENEEVAGLK